MSNPVVANGVIESGRLKVRRLTTFQEGIAGFKEGTEVRVVVEKKTATRSLNQNAWYWGCIVELISEHTGYTADEIHDVLKAKFIPKRLAVADGNGEIKGEFVIGGTTTRLNTLEFGQYCESIRQWAAEDLGVVIPDPQ